MLVLSRWIIPTLFGTFTIVFLFMTSRRPSRRPHDSRYCQLCYEPKAMHVDENEDACGVRYHVDEEPNQAR